MNQDPKRGFRHAGEFFRSVIREGQNVSNPTDARLRIGASTPTTFGNESSGADGGFAVPFEFAQEIFDLSTLEDSLISLCDRTPIDGNSMAFPQDESAPWGSQGPQAYWQIEASAATLSKPSLRNDFLSLNKLIGLVPVTDELMSDASALGSYLTKSFAKRLRWKSNDSLLFGTGVQQCLGAFNSGAAITIAKESGQLTQTLAVNNLTKMMARLPPGSFARAVWLMSGDAIPAFFSMANALSSVYLPGGQDMAPTLSGSVMGLVLGRPAVISPHAKSFSSQGDVMLVDLDYIRVIEKSTGAEMASSMHVYFDADLTAFRVSYRLDATPKVTTPIAPANGTTQLSPFIQLGAR